MNVDTSLEGIFGMEKHDLQNKIKAQNTKNQKVVLFWDSYS